MSTSCNFLNNTEVVREFSEDLVGEQWASSVKHVESLVSGHGNTCPTVHAVMLTV